MHPVGYQAAILITPLLFFSCAFATRSTLDHRPVNPSTVAISKDPMANSLGLNSMYTLLYSIYELRHEPDSGFRYASMPEEKVFDIIRKDSGNNLDTFGSTKYPTLHFQRATSPRPRPLNLVIVLEESLGAEFVGSLGGLPLTPHLDELSKQGIWFTRLYATGTRSVRGIEAVISGFSPTPASSVVKLGKSQDHFFTLASLLSGQGYNTSFIYGGEAQFDNMRRFFMNNGFDNVIDEKDYSNPNFKGSWGVSDEDLFNKADEYFSSLGDAPFFSLVFTSSNHTPFEFPDNRITLYDKEKNTVNNAVKYADYALGGFIDKARQSSYWDNTLFLIVADHNSRVFGAHLVPIERFHIPGLILGKNIEAKPFEKVASQIDLAPTLLSLIGVSATHPMIGHDLTLAQFSKNPGRAIMQYYDTQAYMEGDQVVIFQKNKNPTTYIYDKNKLIDKELIDPTIVDRAVANSLWPSAAYENGLYQWPPTTGDSYYGTL